MKRIVTTAAVFAAAVILFAAPRPTKDGRAVVADEGVFPPGVFGKAAGYLPGDVVTVTNPAAGISLDVLILGAIDNSEGIAILLSAEAAGGLFINQGSQAVVSVTKKTNAFDAFVSPGSTGMATDPDKEPLAAIPGSGGLSKNFEEPPPPPVQETAPPAPAPEPPAPPPAPVEAPAVPEPVAPAPVAEPVTPPDPIDLKPQEVAAAEPEPEPAAPLYDDVIGDPIALNIKQPTAAGIPADQPGPQAIALSLVPAAARPPSAARQEGVEAIMLPAPVPETQDSFLSLVPAGPMPPSADQPGLAPAPYVPASAQFPATGGQPGIGTHLEPGKYYVQIATAPTEDRASGIVAQYGNTYPLVRLGSEASREIQILVGPLTVDEYGAVLAHFKSYGFSGAFLRRP